jgi:hypothetical protein
MGRSIVCASYPSIALTPAPPAHAFYSLVADDVGASTPERYSQPVLLLCYFILSP